MKGRWLWMLWGLALFHLWGAALFLGWAREAYLSGGWRFAFPHLLGLAYMLGFGVWSAWAAWKASQKPGEGKT